MIRQTFSVAVRLATTTVGRRLASTNLVFLAGITRVAGVTRITGVIGEFERRFFSGRCEALRRRVAGELLAHSNLFDGGLAIRQPDYLRKIVTPHRKGCTKSFWQHLFTKRCEKRRCIKTKK